MEYRQSITERALTHAIIFEIGVIIFLLMGI